MAVLQTGQSFSSGDQVTATKLQDIANLATFRTGTNQTADDSTIEVDGSGGYLKVKSAGISANELATDSVITDKIQDGAVTAAKLDSAAVSVLMPAGTILPYAGLALPGNPGDWLFCDGSAIDREISPGVIAPLFDAIDTTYGIGDGSTTFNLPDLRGRVIAGQDDMGGADAGRLTNQPGGVQGDQLGATGGAEVHTLVENEIPDHDHTTPFNNFAGVDGTSMGDGAAYEPNRSDSSYPARDTGSTGGGGAHNNVQPTIILNYIIKT